MLEKILAKSKGVNLINHTDDVIRNVKNLSENYVLSEDEKTKLVLSATLHDIGKITSKFQKLLKKGVDIYQDEKIKHSHNIIGWYFVKSYVNHKDKDIIANMVLWHHANYNSCERLNEELSKISKEITSDDMVIMREFCNYYKIPLLEEENENGISESNEFYRVDNLLRSILVASDVLASSNESIKDYFHKEDVDLNKIDSGFLSSDRTKKQLEIIDLTKDKTSTLIKAPTGFGKIMLGVLWTLKRKNKLIWVCPTNVITESVYDNIIKALKMLNLNMSVELYLSGERKDANNNLSDFSSDIVVTNIDNFIKPCISNKYGARCLMIYDTDVIFDEPHEYDSMDCALFSLFNNIMYKRHNILNSTTLLLTATPTDFRFIVLKGKSLEVLPNKKEHFKALHSEDYKIHFVESVPEEALNGEFVYFNNTVDDVQKSYDAYNGEKMIFHGRYLEEDKKKKKKLILDNYGEGGDRKPVGVFTNQVLTTACDYSVNKMFIKAPTILLFFQCIGRLNRWSKMGLCNVYIITSKSKSDFVFIGNEDENKLQEDFVKELSQEFGDKKTTLDELYVFYNNFVEKHISRFKSISRDKKGISENMLKLIYPKKSKNNKSKTKVCNSNLLRKSTSADEMYIYVKKTNSEDFVTMNINVQKNIGISKMFNEDEKTYREQLKLIKTFESYNEDKKITPEIIKKESVFYDSPYPVFNYVYDENLGLVKKV